MLRTIIKNSIRYRFVIISIALLIAIFGVIDLKRMPLDVFPEFDPPMVEIQTEALGLSAEEVESLITLNIEEFLSGVPWVKTIHSESVTGLSSVILIFERGTDIMKARQLVQENLSRAYTMPNVSKPPIMLQPLSTTNRTMLVGITSEKISPMQLSVLARWIIKPRLMGVPGVANVAIWGQRERQLQVHIDSEKLKENKVSQEQVIRTAGDAFWVSPLTFLEASFPGTGGWIETPNQRLGIRHEMTISSPEDLAKMPLHGSADKLLGDVTKVVEGYPPMIGDALINGETGLLLLIEKLPSADTLEVTNGVQSALNAMQSGLPGIAIDSSIFQLSSYIENAIGNLYIAFGLASIGIIALLSLFLRNWRAVLICFSAIPVTLFATLIILNWLGYTFNIMILAGLGIALGIIVDDAIIDVLNIMRRLRQRPDNNVSKESIEVVVRDASFEIRRTISYATIIAILSVTPLFALNSATGAFFVPFAIAYGCALLISMIVALTLTPALATLLLDQPASHFAESEFLIALKNRYIALVEKLVGKPAIAISSAAVAICIGLLIWPLLGKSLHTEFQERNLLVEMDGPAGLSHQAMSRMVKRVSDELTALEEVKSVGAHFGRAITGDINEGLNSSQLWVALKENSDYAKGKNAVKNALNDYSGYDFDVHTYLEKKVGEAFENLDDEDIVIRIYGPKRDLLREKAIEVKTALEKINGLTDLQVEGQIEEPHIEVIVDIGKAESHGIKPGDVRRAASTLFAGITVGQLYEEQKVFDVIVWGDEPSRSSLSDVENLLVEGGGANHVRLNEIADIRIVSTPTMIPHEAISPRIDIVANINNGDYTTVVNEIENTLSQFEFPLEYHPVIRSSHAMRDAELWKISLYSLAVAGIIYLLLQVCFESWGLAALALFALPIALVGGFAALWIDSRNLSIGASIGFLAILGLAVRHAIMLINHYQYLERDEGDHFDQPLLVRGAKERFTPITVTALTTAIALLPFIILGQRAGLEVQYPMAVVIFGGVLSSTLMNMFLLPSFCKLFVYKDNGKDDAAEQPHNG